MRKKYLNEPLSNYPREKKVRVNSEPASDVFYACAAFPASKQFLVGLAIAGNVNGESGRYPGNLSRCLSK